MKPKAKSREEIKELIYLFNEFYFEENEVDQRVKCLKSNTDEQLLEKLNTAVTKMWNERVAGEDGFDDVPAELMLYAADDLQLLANAVEEEEEPAPKKKGAKKPPAPEPEEPEEEPEEDGEDSEGDEDAEESVADNAEPPAPPEKRTLPTPVKGLQLELISGATADEIAQAVVLIISKIVEVGKVTILIGDKALPKVSEPAADSLKDIKLWRARLRPNGDLGTREARIAFIEKNNVPIPLKKAKDCADKSLAHSIVKWCELKIRGLV